MPKFAVSIYPKFFNDTKNMLTVAEQPTESFGDMPQKDIKYYAKWLFLSILMLSIGWMVADLCYPKMPIEPIVPLKGGYQVSFQDKTFDVYTVPIAQNGLRLFCVDDQNVPFRDVQTLRGYLQNKNQRLVFAMNAGMYTPENLPKGLYIQNKQTLVALDTATTGFGNFYLQPNGIFAFDDSTAVVLDTKTFQNQTKAYHFATQSGPLLVINGIINPVFTPNATSLYIRNGVGITNDNKIVFAISNQPVNFYTFAALFKEKLGCANALFLDGAISKMYAPDINRLDLDGNLGPFVTLSQM